MRTDGHLTPPTVSKFRSVSPFKSPCKQSAHPEVLNVQEETPASRLVTVLYRGIDPLNDDGTLPKALASFSFSVPPPFSSSPVFSQLVQDFFWHRGPTATRTGADITYSTGNNTVCGDISVNVTDFPYFHSRLSNINSTLLPKQNQFRYFSGQVPSWEP